MADEKWQMAEMNAAPDVKILQQGPETMESMRRQDQRNLIIATTAYILARSGWMWVVVMLALGLGWVGGYHSAKTARAVDTWRVSTVGGFPVRIESATGRVQMLNTTSNLWIDLGNGKVPPAPVK